MIGLFVLASFDAVSALPAAYNALGQTLAAARRIFEVIDTSPAVSEPSSEAPPPSQFDLRVDNLKMRYAETQAWALDGISFAIPEGSCLGVVGQTGAGKTSLLNVLLRFWDFQEGNVRIGGVSLRDLHGETVRGLCAVVAQQTHLFNTSIRENLLLARPGATEEELRAALRDADIFDEVMAMPAGLDTRGRRSRHRPVRGPGPSHRHGPRVPQKRAAADPRRADRGARRRFGTGGARHHRAPGARPHHLADHAPAAGPASR